MGTTSSLPGIVRELTAENAELRERTVELAGQVAGLLNPEPPAPEPPVPEPEPEPTPPDESEPPNA